MTTYLLAGGGTAGHVNPLLAVADALRERDAGCGILVVGTREGLEARLVPTRGYELSPIAKVPFPRRPNRAALSFPTRYRRAVGDVRRLIRDRGVDIVVGFGGYAAAPAYAAARKEHVPYVIHEANAKPGLANRMGARHADAVGAAFPDTPLAGSRVVGMPLRREIVDLDRAGLRTAAAEHFGLRAARRTLLVFGGSLGARRLNEAILGARDDVLAAGWQILHIVGGVDDVADPHQDGYAVRRYVDRMDLAYAMADVVLCRSGAATVSEIGALGLPAVYVPYAVGNGEQSLNAQAAVRAGAARLIPDGEFTADVVRHAVVGLLQDADALDEMRTAAAIVGIRGGAANVVAMIDDVLAARTGAAERGI